MLGLIYSKIPTPSDETQKQVSSRYHPDDIDEMISMKKTMMEAKMKTTFNYRMMPFGKEEYISIEELVVPKLDAEGNIEALLGIIREVNQK